MNQLRRILPLSLALGALAPAFVHAGKIKQTFAYDAAGRLTEVAVDSKADLSEHYTYDASGNIIEQTVNGETAIMTYDDANQLQTRTDANGTTRYVYDDAGRLVEERRDGEVIASYEYGYLDKVTSVTRDGVTTKFHYNARGMLVAKERAGEIVDTFGWDGIRLRLEAEEVCGLVGFDMLCSGNEFGRAASAGQVGLVAKGDTVYANEAHVSGGVPLVSASGSGDGVEASYYDSDYLGTTTAAYEEDGSLETTYETTSYGQGAELADARFTGKPYDADLGAHVFPYRNYRSEMGRWASADPAGFPDGPNQHFYAPVPTMGVDPLGLWTTGTP